MTNDIFDNTILCKKCNIKMQKVNLVKNNFVFRALVCPKCHEKIIHPSDEQEYNKFVDLKNKEFRVKMRLVGNSYTVSIPKEIVSFMREQEKMMNDMVRLCFEDMGRLSLDFKDQELEQDENGQEIDRSHQNTRVVKAREYKIIKNNKPAIHIRQFSDSANPKNNKTQIIKNKFEEEEE
jgi:hypothetical protein